MTIFHWLTLMLLFCAGVLGWRWQLERRRRIAAEAQTNQAVARAQEALAQAQARAGALFDSMVEGVVVLAPQGRVQLANRSFLRLFNLPANLHGESLLGTPLGAELTVLAERLKSEPRLPAVEMALPGSADRAIEVNAAAVQNGPGPSTGAIFVIREVTPLKQLEKTRQEFVANVSHELRTPLSLIKGFTETLLEGAKDDPTIAVKFLRNIEKHANRLMFLIEDLLTISRLESRQVGLNFQAVDVRGLTKRVLDDLESRAGEKDTDLKNAVSETLVAYADAERLQQVLYNLVENAIKYGRPKGCVTVGGRQQADGKLELWVKDDGPGVPAEARERIFERFYRVDRARSRETGGTGLGLSIVKHIVQAHGGEVWVNSELGRGATFYFTLSTADGPAGDSEALRQDL
jgi:two-component system phosphate regulon sensor histidine kinase PhoR